MKTILCYGDSNTWGSDPETGQRLPPDVRWTGVMRLALGEGFTVIEEGLPGRTTVWDDPLEDGRNGRAYFLPCLESHTPLDLVLILLGTNDLKTRFALSPLEIAYGAAKLAYLALGSSAGPRDEAPQVMLLAPPPTKPLTDIYAMTLVGAEVKSALFATCYRHVAEEIDCPFFDTGSVIESSAIDGIHFDREAHRALGLALANQVRQYLE